MEDNFYKDEFENFLQEQANNHRMYPSDSIWRNIDKKLHGDKTWPALTIAAFAFLAAIIAVSVYFSPGPSIFSVEVATVKPENIDKPSTPLLSSVANSSNQIQSRWNISEGYKNNNSPQSSTDVMSLSQTQVASVIDIDERTQNVSNAILNAKRSIHLPANVIKDGSSLTIIEENSNELNAKIEASGKINEKLSSPSKAEVKIALEEKAIEKAVVDEYLKQHPTDISNAALATNKSKSKFSYKVYITPSKSFRRLEEDPLLQQKQPSIINGPVAINYASDVNKIVRHIPGNGVEAGLAFGYNLTDRIKVTTGFQFNVRQYYIEAFLSNPEVATIALQTSTGIDTVSRSSIYRTSSGFSATELINRYYQLSVPVGVELKVLGSKDISLHVAASVQPTYTINNNAYLISTNFKNYTEGGPMLRNWNINTNVEAFLNFESGDFKWQLGPQFRYQQLPTFTSQYPIREHLIDYGVKIGVLKTIR